MGRSALLILCAGGSLFRSQIGACFGLPDEEASLARLGLWRGRGRNEETKAATTPKPTDDKPQKARRSVGGHPKWIGQQTFVTCSFLAASLTLALQCSLRAQPLLLLSPDSRRRTNFRTFARVCACVRGSLPLSSPLPQQKQSAALSLSVGSSLRPPRSYIAAATAALFRSKDGRALVLSTLAQTNAPARRGVHCCRTHSQTRPPAAAAAAAAAPDQADLLPAPKTRSRAAAEVQPAPLHLACWHKAITSATVGII